MTLPSTEAVAALEREVLEGIPLARAMALRVEAWDGTRLVLAAPLAPNVNDKGCAFGGSLASLMTLAGWGLLTLALGARGIVADIYVQDSSIRYLAPVWQDFRAVARLAPPDGIGDFVAAFGARGKARARLRCTVPLADGSDAAVLEAGFVAMARR